MRLILLSLSVCLSLPCWAAPKRGEPKEEAIVLKPIVSKEGVQRIFNAVETVEANIKDAQSNIVLCEKNRTVVLAELKELALLENEQKELINRYKVYLATARAAIDKNEEGGETIKRWEKEHKGKVEETKGLAQTDLITKMNNARLDKEQRQKWKADADAKVARVTKLLGEAETVLKGILARRIPLRSQIDEWEDKQGEFKKLLRELAVRKIELTKLAQEKKMELPPEDSEP